MKILFCSSFVYHSSNGAAIFAQLFVEWAKEQAFTLHIISDEENDKGFIPLIYHNPLFKKLPFIQQYQRSYIFYKTVEKHCTEENYDLIFFNNLHESLHTARFIKHIPVKAFLHDENFMKDYKENPSLKRKLYRTFMKNMERKASGELQQIITNSQYMKVNVESIYKVHPVKLDYLYFRSFDMPAQSIKNEEITLKTILFIKHDYERGGLKELIAAINSIDLYKLKLIVIGPDKSVHSALEKSVQEHCIELYEYQSRDEIHKHFSQVNVFCVPSHSEAMGISNFEAMSYEIPVVTTDIPVMKELNENRDIINLVPVNDIDALASALKRVFEKDDKVLERLERAKSFVEIELSKKRVFAELDKVIKRNIC